MDMNELLADRLPRGEVELPGIGTIQLRGVSRYELVLAGKGTEDGNLIEARLLAYALVEPTATVGQVQKWQRSASAGEFGRVVDKMRELSGLAEGADKSGVQGSGGESDAGV